MILGQIELGTEYGNFLYNFCKNQSEILTVVEIGTWRGMGSTKCFIQGLMDSKKEGVSFYSLEINREMYDVACQCWEGKLPSWAKLIHGSIVGVDEMEVEKLKSIDSEKIKWFEEDKRCISSCPNVLDQLPESIDLLFLDGGGFTTEREFEKLKDRSMLIAVDDSLCPLKGKKIREIAMQSPDQYEIIIDAPNLRGGMILFANKKNCESI